MTIYKKQYIGTDKEVKFDAGNIAYNFSFQLCRRMSLRTLANSSSSEWGEISCRVVEAWDSS